MPVRRRVQGLHSRALQVTRAVLSMLWLVVACSLQPPSPVVSLVDARGSATCTAFAVQPRRLVTAAHCVHGSTASYVRQAPVVLGVEQARLLASNAGQDWAVLEPASDLPTFAVAAPLPGLLAVQTSQGSLLESYFDGLAADGSDVRRWSASIDVRPGWSGSPVLQHGLAVGILQSCRGTIWPRKACVRPGFATFFPTTQVPL